MGDQMGYYSFYCLASAPMDHAASVLRWFGAIFDGHSEILAPQDPPQMAP